MRKERIWDTTDIKISKHGLRIFDEEIAQKKWFELQTDYDGIHNKFPLLSWQTVKRTYTIYIEDSLL